MVRVRVTSYKSAVINASDEKEARKKARIKLGNEKKTRVTVVSVRKIG